MSYSVTKPLYFDFTARGDRAARPLSALLRLWHFRWSSRRTLAEMPQEHLADIGVSRGDAMREAAKPFWRA